VVGSITHCDGYRASAVAWASEMLGVGIDAEPADRLPEGVLRRVAVDQEQSWLRELTLAYPAVSWDRLLFSAKEAVYKVWYPLTGKELGFTDALIAFDQVGTFDARLLVPGPTTVDRGLTNFAGRWLARDGLVLTAIAIPSSRSNCTPIEGVAHDAAGIHPPGSSSLLSQPRARYALRIG